VTHRLITNTIIGVVVLAVVGIGYVFIKPMLNPPIVPVAQRTELREPVAPSAAVTTPVVEKKEAPVAVVTKIDGERYQKGVK
jgi:hypothetical protein